MRRLLATVLLVALSLVATVSVVHAAPPPGAVYHLCDPGLDVWV